MEPTPDINLLNDFEQLLVRAGELFGIDRRADGDVRPKGDAPRHSVDRIDRLVHPDDVSGVLPGLLRALFGPVAAEMRVDDAVQFAQHAAGNRSGLTHQTALVGSVEHVSRIDRISAGEVDQADSVRRRIVFD
jgi:hypothetical protein